MDGNYNTNQGRHTISEPQNSWITGGQPQEYLSPNSVNFRNSYHSQDMSRTSFEGSPNQFSSPHQGRKKLIKETKRITVLEPVEDQVEAVPLPLMIPDKTSHAQIRGEQTVIIRDSQPNFIKSVSVNSHTDMVNIWIDIMQWYIENLHLDDRTRSMIMLDFEAILKKYDAVSNSKRESEESIRQRLSQEYELNLERIRREEAERGRGQIDNLRRELTTWQQKYNDLQKNSSQQPDFTNEIRRLSLKVREYEERINSLMATNSRLESQITEQRSQIYQEGTIIKITEHKEMLDRIMHEYEEKLRRERTRIEELEASHAHLLKMENISLTDKFYHQLHSEKQKHIHEIEMKDNEIEKLRKTFESDNQAEISRIKEQLPIETRQYILKQIEMLIDNRDANIADSMLIQLFQKLELKLKESLRYGLSKEYESKYKLEAQEKISKEREKLLNSRKAEIIQMREELSIMIRKEFETELGTKQQKYRSKIEEGERTINDLHNSLADLRMRLEREQGESKLHSSEVVQALKDKDQLNEKYRELKESIDQKVFLINERNTEIRELKEQLREFQTESSDLRVKCNILVEELTRIKGTGNHSDAELDRANLQLFLLKIELVRQSLYPKEQETNMIGIHTLPVKPLQNTSYAYLWPEEPSRIFPSKYLGTEAIKFARIMAHNEESRGNNNPNKQSCVHNQIYSDIHQVLDEANYRSGESRLTHNQGQSHHHTKVCDLDETMQRIEPMNNLLREPYQSGAYTAKVNKDRSMLSSGNRTTLLLEDHERLKKESDDYRIRHQSLMRQSNSLNRMDEYLTKEGNSVHFKNTMEPAYRLSDPETIHRIQRYIAEGQQDCKNIERSHSIPYNSQPRQTLNVTEYHEKVTKVSHGDGHAPRQSN